MAARAGGAAHVIAIDTVEDRLAIARDMGAEAVHATEEDPRRAVKAATAGRGVDIAVDAVGNPKALETCCRLARKAGTVSVIGVYAERVEVHMGILWLKSLNLVTGHANVMGHLDKVLALLASGALNVDPLVSREMKLDDAADAYAAYDRREALKIVLRA
jgi:alcohol dehydrogenase